MAGISWESIVDTVSGAVVGLTAMAGAIAANNRVRRASGEVAADAFSGPESLTAVRVRATVRSTGLGRLKLADGSDSPSITVTQVDIGDSGQQTPMAAWRKDVLAGEIVDPGEATAATFVFLVTKASARTLGWEVSFQFGVHRRWPKRNEVWYWTDTTFVSVPSQPGAQTRRRYNRIRRS